jgi:hypothetical protein
VSVHTIPEDVAQAASSLTLAGRLFLPVSPALARELAKDGVSTLMARSKR